MPRTRREWLYLKTRVVNDCLIYGGETQGNGYGRVWTNEGRFLAHRLAWELNMGPIPDKMVIKHSCDERKCVNVSHLSAGTQKTNIREAVYKRRVDRMMPKKHADRIRLDFKRMKVTFAASKAVEYKREVKEILNIIDKRGSYGVPTKKSQ